MVPRHRVLIVDPLEETREVLRSVLEPHGVTILATDEPIRGLALARQHEPQLIVLDAEQLVAARPSLAKAFAAQSRVGTTSLLIIGGTQRRSDLLPPGEFVAKPYHYASLIRKIEELLAQHQQSVARAA